MEKILLTLIGIIVLTVLSSAQDIGRLRQIMLMRQRDMALRRGGFPFGVGVPFRGPGIPPPLAARLALLERQRAFSPFIATAQFGSPFDTPFLGSPFRPGGPFSSPFSLPGPSDINRFDLSTLGFVGGPGETFTVLDTDGLSTVGGPSGMPSIGGPSIGGPSGMSSTGGANSFSTIGGQPGISSIGGASGFSSIGGQPGMGGPSGVPSGLPPSGGLSGVSGETAGSGNMFGQQPTQAAEFLETNRGTVEPGPQMGNNVMAQRQASRNGFRPIDVRQNNRRPNGPLSRFRPRSDNPRDRRPPVPLSAPEVMPPMPLVASNDPMRQVRAPVPIPVPVPLNQQMMFPRPPRRPRMPPRRSNRRRNPRRRRNQRPTTPRVFPNVPEIPQIPAAPNSQGQSNEGQQGNTGFGQDGSGQTNSQSFTFTNQPGMPQNGDPRMGPQPFFPGQITGIGNRFPTTPGGFPTPMGPGGVIFPSQAAQGPITRQPGPGFTGGPSTVFTRAPNGQRQQQVQGGTQAFDQNNQFSFQSGEGRPGGFPAGAVFPGRPGSPFGQPFIGPAPGQMFNGQAFGGRAQGRQMFGPGFGFVDPSTGAAGPAFSTNNQSPEDFNLQFQPLPNNQNMRPMPEMRPDQNQMGIGPNNPQMNSGFFPSGMGQTNMQFGGGVGQMDMQAGGASQGNTFNGGAANVITTNMGSNQQTDGAIRFDTGSGQTSSLTVSDRIVNENSASNNNGEFRLVEVGNIVNRDGLVKSGGAEGASNDMNTVTITETQTTGFQPTGDIGTAFASFGEVTSKGNMIDLNAADNTSDVTSATVDASAAGSVISTPASPSGMPESPFANSINKDFSFFMVDNSQPPIDMPPINVPSSNTAATDAASIEAKDGFISSTDGFSSAFEPLIIKGISGDNANALSNPDDGFQAIYTEFLASPGDNGFTTVVSGPPGSQTMTFPVTGTTANEATSSGDQGVSFTMTSSSSSSSSSTGSSDNTMGDIIMTGTPTADTGNTAEGGFV